LSRSVSLVGEVSMRSNLYQVRSRQEQGQGLSEYVLILVFIGLATVAVMGALEWAISSQFENVTKCIGQNGSRALTSSTCEIAELTPAPGSLTDSDSNSSDTTGPAAPSADFTFSCAAFTCTFTNTSSDSDGSIVLSSWTFGDSSNSAFTSPSKTYSAAGNYTVSLTVKDDSGMSSSTSKAVSISESGNVAPTANFTVSCASFTCSFINSSSDSDGSIASSLWTFDDASSSSNMNTNKTYSAAGTYNVTLMVTDNGGLSHRVSKSFVVEASGGSVAGPNANFSASCTDLVCSFINSSVDADGAIISSSWTFGDSGTSILTSPSKTYAAGGTYTVTLTVTDNAGLSSNVTKSISVTASSTPNLAPTANFTPNCTSLTCTFTDSSSDSDGSIASSLWTFGDSSTSTLTSPSKTYAAGGTYTVTLTVTDNAGLSHSISKSISLTAANTAPTAAISSTCLNLSCDFSGASSSDSDGTISSYAWNFGNSSSSSNTATGLTSSHSFTAVGTYTVTLVVTDNGGLSNSISKSITVALNVAPVARFNVSCVNKVCSFTSTSTDSDGTIASYAWDFDNNGTSDATGSTASYTYSNSVGNTTAKLTVTDNAGASNSVTKNFSANDSNVAPVANYSYTCSYLVCTFTNSSTDSDGSIASSTWSFGDTTSSATTSPSKTYSAGGTFTVTLLVTDNGGSTNSTTKTITVAANVAPVAAYTYACTYLTCNFSNSSTDANGSGTISNYSWAFGDSTSSSTTSPSKTYAAAGTYNITLTVTDSGGLSNTVTKSITVGPNAAPVANFVFDCSYLTCNFTNTSTDSDGSISSSAWSFGDNTSSSNTSPSKTYGAAGTYNVTLTVTDNGGISTSVTKTVVTTVTSIDLYIDDVDAPLANGTIGSSERWTLNSLDFHVRDSNGNNVIGAVIQLTNGKSCTTDSNGNCRMTGFSILLSAANSSTTLTISTVTKSGYNYRFSLNSDADTDDVALGDNIILIMNPR
jgi:PKD repeat protein/Flp pilus assembly pilin Flp